MIEWIVSNIYYFNNMTRIVPRKITSALATVVLFLMVFWIQGAFGQQTDSAGEPLSSYLTAGTASGYGVFRDEATSPLSYSGVPGYSSFGYFERVGYRETRVSLGYMNGSFTPSLSAVDAQSDVQVFQVRFHEVYRLNRAAEGKFNTYLGWQFRPAFVLRENDALMNNSTGADLVVNISLAAKASLDISRTKTEQVSLLGLPLTLKPRQRELSFQLNTGLLNMDYRNGYAYLPHASMLNDDSYLSDHSFRFFSGFGINSSLDYTHGWQNGNALRLAYRWDAWQTGGEERLVMANHLLAIELLIRLNPLP